MRVYDQSVIDQLNKAREYHFHNMHVYVNGLFREDPVAYEKCAYKHFEPKTTYFSNDHHVHIYLWRLNTGIENILEMCKFIGEVNKIVSRPVYIHMPKRMLYENDAFVSDFKAILSGMTYEGNDIRYQLIMEKNSNVTEFQYGDWVPIPGQKYGSTRFVNSSLLISWDHRGYARPTFYSKLRKASRSGFKE